MYVQLLFAINEIFRKEIDQNSSKKIILDYFDKNWSEILQLQQQNGNLSIESYLNHMNSILDSNVPFKKFNKYKL